MQEQYERIKPLLPEYLAKVDVTESRYQTNLKNLMSNVRTRPTLVLQQCAEYLIIPEAEMRERFKETIEAIEAYKGGNEE